MKRRILCFVVLSVFGLVNFVFAAGIEIREIGARADALGGAFRAVADDGTAVFWNPAGLTQIKKQAITLESPLIKTDAKVSQNYYNSGVLSGYNTLKVNQVKKWETVPTFAYANGSNNLKYGLGIYVQHGLGTEYDFFSDPAYSTYPEYDWKSKGQFLSIHPAVAKQINDRVSVGLGIFATKGNLEQRGILVLPGALFDTALTGVNLPVDSYMNGDGWGYGGNIGILCKANNEFTWALTYRTATQVKLSGDTEVNVYGPGLDIILPGRSASSTNIALPANVGFGLVYRPLPDFMLSTDIDWTEWSSFDRFVVKNDSPGGIITPTSTLINEWENVIRYSMGIKYNIEKNLCVYGGYYMDPTPIPDKTLTPWVPDSGTKQAFDIGLGYETERFEIICGYEHQAAAGRTVTTADLNADGTLNNLPGNYTLKTSTIRIGANILF